MITRYYNNLEDYLKPSKAVILYGPRRVGKTTLLRRMLSRTSLRYRLDSGENLEVQQILGSHDFRLIDEYVKGYDLIALDEAQQIPGIGLALKIIVDQYPEKLVIATGSSSFELASQIGEPLVGRKITLTLYPVAQTELLKDAHDNRFDMKQNLEKYLLYGGYPEVLTSETTEDKVVAISDIVNSYLFKDVLAQDNIKGSDFILRLVRLLAHQVGSEVSLSELATHAQADVKTVARYIDLLEKTFVIVRLGAYSRNLRREVTRKQKYYFLDNGIRNGVISQFNSLDKRDDVGAIWENFLMVERMKKRSYERRYGSLYFWRTYDQKEIDLIEDYDGKLHAYEFKYSANAIAPSAFTESYPDATFETVNRDNYLDFIG